MTSINREAKSENSDFTLADFELKDDGDTAPLVADSALREILGALGTAQSFRDCMRQCALILHQWTHADAAFISRLVAGGDELELVHSVGFPREMSTMSFRMPVEGTLAGQAIRQQQLMSSQKISEDSRISPYFREKLHRMGVQTVVVIPLLMHADVVGVIVLAWRRRLHLSDRERDQLMHIGYGIAIAVEHDLREFESTRDSLTGVLNRRSYIQRVVEFRKACALAGTPLALAMIDLDNFKACNDTHGHLVGDEVLRGVANEIQDAMLLERGNVFRVGGEEFVLLLPNCHADHALNLLETIRSAVASRRFLDEDKASFHVTLSAGIALYNFMDEESLSDFYSRADQAMYQAKTLGKNRVVLATQPGGVDV